MRKRKQEIVIFQSISTVPSIGVVLVGNVQYQKKNVLFAVAVLHTEKIIMNESNCCEVPLVELLESVPETCREFIEISPTQHRNIPYGRLCHDAAKLIHEVLDAAEADRYQWKKRVEKAEQDMISWRSLAQEMTPGGSEFMSRDVVRRYYREQKDSAHQAKIDCVRLNRQINALQNAIAASEPTWIPTHGPGSRRPTEQDCCDDGRVLMVRWTEKGFAGWRFSLIVFRDFESMAANISHFLPTKFTPAPDPDTEAMANAWKQHGGTVWTQEHDFKAGWSAALAHRDAQQKVKRP